MAREAQRGYPANGRPVGWLGAAGKRVSRRRIIGVGGLGGASLLGLACGGSTKSSPSSPTAGAKTTGTPRAAQSQNSTPAGKQAKQGGSVNIRVLADPPNWSPFTASTYTAAFADHCYSKLVQLDVSPKVDPSDVVVQPDLIEKMPETPDNLTYVFSLRQGVKFHNLAPANGREMTADDVKAAIDAYRGDDRSASKADYTSVESVEVVDPRTVRVRLKEPYVPLLGLSAGHYGWRIFPKEMLDGDQLKTTAVGTGPFMFDSYAPSSKATYKRNPTYFKSGLPYLDNVTLSIIPQDSSAISAFQTGQIDVLSQIDCTSAQQLRSQKPDAHYQQTYDTFPGGYIAFDTTRPPFNDVRVRQAVSMAFNRKAEIDSLECGEGRPDQLIPSGAFKTALPIDQLGASAKFWNYDPQAAKQLLSDAGLSGGFDVPVLYTPQYGQAYQDSAERAIADLQAVGIRAKPQSVQYNDWISSIYRPPFNFQGILWGPSRYYADVDPYVWYWLNPDPKQGIANQSRINDPNLLPLLQKQRQTLDQTERLKVIGDIQKIVAEQQYYTGRTTGNAYTFWPSWLQDWTARLGYDVTQLERTWDSRR